MVRSAQRKSKAITNYASDQVGSAARAPGEVFRDEIEFLKEDRLEVVHMAGGGLAMGGITAAAQAASPAASAVAVVAGGIMLGASHAQSYKSYKEKKFDRRNEMEMTSR